MSSASFSSSSSSKTEKGFSQRRFLDFLNRGNQLANPQATRGLQAGSSNTIGAFKPPELSRTTTTSTNRAGGLAKFFGASDSGTSVNTTGFLGEFAKGVTSEQLDSLTNTFLQRQRSIRQRRAQPGRAALFLARS